MLQPLGSVVVAYCMHGVEHSHSCVCLVGRYYCGGLWGGAVSCDGMVGCAGPADLVGEACLLIVGA